MSRQQGEETTVRRDEMAAERLKALGHPVRIAIVRELAKRSCCCCADVCGQLPLAQSTVSQHLKILREAGLISFRRDGVRSSYVLNRAAFAALCGELEEMSAVACGASAPISAGESR